MTTNINSKHGIVSKQPAELYMAFADLRNFLQFIPEVNRGDVTADYDTITATVQGFKIGIMIKERTPYSRIDFIDDGAPFQFNGSLHFDAAASDPYKTDFYIEFSADLNLMMKMLLGKKLKEGMDKVVDALVAMSEGRMPEGVDEDTLKKMKEGLDKNRQQ
ncbi:MAG: hypothetical protein PUK70_02150 [Bacteroidales bacterium]|nr:hypothetical protein [Bacteroidales bacterium]MDY6001258.1 hypothetical protein [Candidatus Cryptobacteroides sp.]